MRIHLTFYPKNATIIHKDETKSFKRKGESLMKQIPIAELIPGMVTAEDILTYDSRIIVPKGVVLTENIISRLEGYSIYYVHIHENLVEELNQPMICPPPANFHDAAEGSSKSNKERIKNSHQFALFQQAFNRCAEHYQGSLTNALYRNETFPANELIKETLQILHPVNGDISVFDMLLNMHNIDDSVYMHCIDVALISNVLSRWLHFSEADQKMATACGLFHDIGKFMLPSGVLRKPGKLTSEEFEIVKTHTIEGFHLLNKYRNIPEPVKNTAIMHHENVGVSITGNSTNPTRFQHPVAGTYKKECIEQGKKYFSVASGGGTGRTLHPDNMAAGPASYGMTDTLGRMHSDAQFAGSSSVPAHVEMMGLIGAGNNPMVGMTVAVAVSVEEAANEGKF